MLPLPGAVVGAAPDGGVAAHYGDPSREQRRLAAGRAVVDLGNLAVVAVTGSDRLSWLDTLTSQRVRDLAPGAARAAAPSCCCWTSTAASSTPPRWWTTARPPT
ncbi:hypothetical protein [Serinibacter arcticus]|uniref:hypothetical protein n=1 Tax=Serinibacter arcticus TaxID=1655435 RepID=UPI0026B392B4